MSQLKEKLLSSFIAFEEQKNVDSYVHGIRTKSIKKFEKALEKAITTIPFKNKIGSKLSGGLDSSSISGLLLSKNPWNFEYLSKVF